MYNFLWLDPPGNDQKSLTPPQVGSKLKNARVGSLDAGSDAPGLKKGHAPAAVYCALSFLYAARSGNLTWSERAPGAASKASRIYTRCFSERSAPK
jgi:hypothetical protein